MFSSNQANDTPLGVYDEFTVGGLSYRRHRWFLLLTSTIGPSLLERPLVPLLLLLRFILLFLVALWSCSERRELGNTMYFTAYEIVRDPRKILHAGAPRELCFPLCIVDADVVS